MPWMVMAMLLHTPEIPYDNIDQDGDGVDLVDVDGDGFPSVLAGGRDCNDRSRWVRPDAWDGPGDGVDADCEGLDGMRDLSRRERVRRFFASPGAVLYWLTHPGR